MVCVISKRIQNEIFFLRLQIHVKNVPIICLYVHKTEMFVRLEWINKEFLYF